MPIGISDSLDFQARALQLRSQRQELLAANIANADTPNFKARDIDFATALQAATSAGTVRERNEALVNPETLYRLPDQASGDGNSVDMDLERANFADNAMRYEATLRFINGRVRGLLSAIRGD